MDLPQNYQLPSRLTGKHVQSSAKDYKLVQLWCMNRKLPTTATHQPFTFRCLSILHHGNQQKHLAGKTTLNTYYFSHHQKSFFLTTKEAFVFEKKDVPLTSTNKQPKMQFRLQSYFFIFSLKSVSQLTLKKGLKY